MIFVLAFGLAAVWLWLKRRSSRTGLTGAETVGIALEVRRNSRAARAGHARSMPRSRLRLRSRGGF